MTPPLVVITSPKPGAVVEHKPIVTILVTAGDDSGVISEVIVYVNKESVCKLTTAPYECLWKVPDLPGNRRYGLQASARDAAGNTGLSAFMRVRVEAKVAKSPAKVQQRQPAPPRARTPWGTPEW